MIFRDIKAGHKVYLIKNYKAFKEMEVVEVLETNQILMKDLEDGKTYKSPVLNMNQSACQVEGKAMICTRSNMEYIGDILKNKMEGKNKNV